jgi:hypothetical protein
VGSGENERGRRGDSIPYLTYCGDAPWRSNFTEEDAAAVLFCSCAGSCSGGCLLCTWALAGGCGCRREAVLRQEREGAGAALEGTGRMGGWQGVGPE